MLKILIAEDDAVSSIIIKTFLAPYGDCDVSYNGQEAIDMFREKVSLGETYDLVLLDVMMPIKTGLQALKEIRKIESNAKNLKRSNILMLTALNDNETIRKALENGCDSYFTKPIKKDKILVALERLRLIKK